MPRIAWKYLLLSASLAIAIALVVAHARAPALPVLATPAAPIAPAELDGVLIRHFESSDCDAFFLAQRSLIAIASPAVVAYLVGLLEREESAPFGGCGNLYYPGAEEFYGHGLMVPYDLDRLAGRAAWVLDQLCFDRFGFATGYEPSDAATRTRQAAAAAAWWKAQAGHFSRVEQLIDALDHGDPDRQDLALSEVYNDAGLIAGLDERRFRLLVRPRARLLRWLGDAEVARTAERVLRSEIDEFLAALGVWLEDD